jgi:sec-independent protein translocase protein TatA
VNISGVEWVIVLVAAFVLFGPKRLPELGRALGKSIREFKKATSGLMEEEETVSKETTRR